MPRRNTSPPSSPMRAPPEGRCRTVSNGITIDALGSESVGGARMRSARVLVLFVTAILIASACGGTAPVGGSPPGPGGAAPATTTPKPPPVKIRSSYGNVTPSNLAPFLAKELGLFEKYNPVVTPDPIKGGAQPDARPHRWRRRIVRGARVGQHAGREFRWDRGHERGRGRLGHAGHRAVRAG